MIYLVSKQQIIDSFTDDITQISVEESLKYLSKQEVLQFDSETSGRLK